MSLSQVSIHAWIQEHGIKTETGNQLDFKDHLFMFDIYNDWSPHLVCMKAAQVTFSTMAILKTLYLAKMKGLDIIYTLPAASDVKDFVGSKVNRIINANPILMEYVKDRDTIEQKRVGDNILYYRGTWTERAAIAVSADLNVFDEIDRSNFKVIEQYASRLQHSKFAWDWRFSNPSYEGVGTHKAWMNSDQRHWFITCSGCEQEQFLEWPVSIDEDRKCFQCKHCHKELTRDERRVGNWVSMGDPNAKYRGYWISLLMCPWIKAEYILQKFKEMDRETFYNFVLGLPYVGSDNKLTQEALMQNLTDKTNDQSGRIVIGVDTGLDIHLVVGNKQGLFYHNSSESYDEFESLMERFPKAIAVFDAQGDLHKPRELQEKYRGRIFLCYYQRDRKTNQLIRWGEREEFGVVRADRNRMIQLLVDEFRGKRIPLFGSDSDWWNYWIHWNNIYRSEEEDKQLHIPKREWKRSGPDHLVHASVYWRVGIDRFGSSGEAEFVGQKPIFTGKSSPTIYDNKFEGYLVGEKPDLDF